MFHQRGRNLEKKLHSYQMVFVLWNENGRSGRVLSVVLVSLVDGAFAEF